MKLRLYSPENYQRELGGDGSALKRSGFVAALRAYRMLEDKWLEYPPQPAAKLIKLAPEDYKVDQEHKALLLRKLPHGFPVSARDVISWSSISVPTSYVPFQLVNNRRWRSADA